MRRSHAAHRAKRRASRPVASAFSLPPLLLAGALAGLARPDAARTLGSNPQSRPRWKVVRGVRQLERTRDFQLHVWR